MPRFGSTRSPLTFYMPRSTANKRCYKAWGRLIRGLTPVALTIGAWVIIAANLATAQAADSTLKIRVEPIPFGFRELGDIVTLRIGVENDATNFSVAEQFTNIVISDSRLGTLCAISSLWPGTQTSCTAVYTIDSLDLAAGHVTSVISATGDLPHASFTESATLRLPLYGNTNDNGFPKIIITAHKLPGAGSARDGWVLFADRKKQWITPECRAQLEAQRLPLEVLPWPTIDDYAYSDSSLPCDAIGRSSDNTNDQDSDNADSVFPRIIFPAYKLTATGAARDGWVLFADNRKQWVNAACRRALEDRGITQQVLAWQAIDAVPYLPSPVSCEAIGN